MPKPASDAQTRQDPKLPRLRLITIKLEADQMQGMAQQMLLAGRDAEAEQIRQALTRAETASIRMPIEEAVRLAISAHQSRDFKRAGTYYQAVLKAEPKHPRANHFLGVLLHQTQRSKEGLSHIRRSLATLADQGWAWNNLGNVLLAGGQREEAEQAYRKALALDPDMADAHNNYSIICRQQGRLEEAERHADQALALNADFAEAHINRGKIHLALQQPDQAMASFSRALLLQPPAEAGRSRMMLAHAHVALRQLDKAAEVYRRWLKEEPDNVVARHMLVACLGEDVPERAADAYVVETFDRFANSFDSKLAHLGYRAPQLVADALADAYPPHASYGVVADAGCGTGLCAPLLHGRAKRLIGIDLSGGMLAKARERGGYDELHEAELTAFLLDRRGAFDTIICTDTLCYFGVLDGFVQAAHGAMKPGGVLVFTVEALAEGEPGPFRLQLHGRYCHAQDYVESAVSGNGFALRAMTSETLRKEGAKPVLGWVVSATRI